MRAVGLIPARGGSRGIPGKNLAPLAGRPLLAWTVEQARGSTSLDHLAVSTDSAEIAQAAHALGVEVVDRPAELAADTTPMIDVIRHALEVLVADEIVLLQPTSPLRQARDIDGAVALRRSTGASSVVSVVRVPHNFSPESQLRMTAERRLEPYVAGDAAPARQAKPLLYARNGPAVLVVTAETVRRGSLYGEDCRAYEMPPERSLDVDEQHDLELAELLLSRTARLIG